MPPGPMKDFSSALFVTHYIHVVGFFQVLTGVLLLVNRFVPLALDAAGSGNLQYHPDSRP